ncbi:unnamed protein product, partial [Didymodactylos carnosus]
NGLYFQLESEHTKFVEMCKDDDGTIEEYILTVYRGQKLKSYELQTLKDNIGKLVSVNTFFSTTYDKNVALLFAGNGSNVIFSLVECTLFEIEICTAVKTKKPYANIKENTDQLSKALEYHNIALDITSDALGPDHWLMASSYSNLASVYDAIGDIAIAKRYYEKAMEIQTKVDIHHEDRKFSAIYSNIGGLYRMSGDI